MKESTGFTPTAASRVGGSVSTSRLRRLIATLALLLMLGVAPTRAHHNMTAVFDLNERFTLTGLLTKSDWRNPHIDLTVESKNDDGHMDTWVFEGPSPNVFRNLDVAKSDFESSIGRTVTVEASRARDGSHRALIRIITLANGKVVSLCPQNC